MEKYKEIERSIIKKFRKEIWSRFTKSIRDYELIQENDNLMVCISGGKDSFLLAKCIQELQKHGEVHFFAKYVVMDPGYKSEIRKQIINNAEILNVPIEIFETDIFQNVYSMDIKSPCYMCARMRRGHLYNKASELGCNKIVLGHHLDDVIETTLLSMFYASEYKTMLPKVKSDNFEGIELIRPMYQIREKDILSWCNYNNLTFINCACKFTEDSQNTDNSKRLEMKKLLNRLRLTNPNIDYNILTSLNNVNLNCVLGYKKNNVYHSFLDDYDKN